MSQDFPDIFMIVVALVGCVRESHRGSVNFIFVDNIFMSMKKNY